jgi:hypothetical protein
MIPTGAVIPGPITQGDPTIGELLGPASVVAVVAILVALAVIIAGIVALRASAAFKRSSSPGDPASAPARRAPRHAA